MKTLTSYITEAKNYFKLTDEERRQLETVVGIVSGNLGDEEDTKHYQTLIDQFDEDEIRQLDLLYDYLSDTETYKTVSRNGLIEDIELVKRIVAWLDEEGELEMDSDTYRNIINYNK